jgi:RNA polymerase sigma-70 factor (ECF subfamily)
VASEWDRVAERLVAERGDALVRYAYLLCGDRDEAADLVQDALVRTFGRPRRSLELPRAEAYVRRAVLNLVIDRARRRDTWRRVRHLAVEPERPVAAAEAVDERIDLAERLRALSPRQSACLVLRYYEDLPVAEIARVLGIAQGSVKRYLSDGLRALSSSMITAEPAVGTGGGDVQP